ncbi:MAG: class I SAM-dependent methyltransferase [Victivallales bacterium]|nr:class I SAM-dependent methyltransferase [Victivallales bacterium]
MTNNTQRFTNRVADYVRYRPGYPAALFDFLYGDGGFTPADVIADCGSGTGIFTRNLLERGHRVFGIEPNAAMRRAAEEYLHDYPLFVSVAGTAEDSTLPDHAVNRMVCAQAFHWFDPVRFRREAERIIRPGGQLALIWNSRISADGIGAEYERICRETTAEYRQVNHHRLTENDFHRFFGSRSWQRYTWNHQQQLSRAALRGRYFSCSYAPAPESPEGRRADARLHEAFQRYSDGNIVTFPYCTEMYLVRM